MKALSIAVSIHAKFEMGLGNFCRRSAPGMLPDGIYSMLNDVSPVLPAPLRAAVAAKRAPRLGVLARLHLQNLDLRRIK